MGQATSAQSPRRTIAGYFQLIVDGFRRNARATSPDLVACDFAEGTKLKSCCTPSGKTYVSVARMLPALVTMRDSESLSSIFRHAFDPEHPDFWGYAPANKATQRTVESALVADALVRCDRKILEELSPPQRSNIQRWLASCTQVPERKTNHAWFTALNHAARLALSRQFPEFQGDEAWMIEDLRALDAMYGEGTDGWYSDSPDQAIYDYYNFYVFPVFPLMWGRTMGEHYPDWNEKFRGRVTQFLEKTTYFFAADGSYPLMGRSLIYRWALLTPLVLGYQEGLGRTAAADRAEESVVALAIGRFRRRQRQAARDLLARRQPRGARGIYRQWPPVLVHAGVLGAGDPREGCVLDRAGGAASGGEG